LRMLTPLDGSPVLCLALSPYAQRDVAVGHQSGALAVADVSGATPPKKLPARGAEAGQRTLTPPDPQLKGAWYPGGFKPCTCQVKKRFQNVPFKCSARRYTEVHSVAWLPPAAAAAPVSVSGGGGGEDIDIEELISAKDGDVSDAPAVLAVGGRERAVTLWAWRSGSQRVSLRQTLPLPRCPPHLSEAGAGLLARFQSLAHQSRASTPLCSPIACFHVTNLTNPEVTTLRAGAARAAVALAGVGAQTGGKPRGSKILLLLSQSISSTFLLGQSRRWSWRRKRRGRRRR
jgi:hypothetical protein